MSPSSSRIVAVVVALSLAATLAIPNSSYAQRLSPRKPGGGGTGGGPGHVPPPPIGAPTLRPALPEVLPTPKIESPPAPPAAVQVPAAPVIRFRCDLAPNSYECTKPGSDDGGGDDEKCSCARDLCRINERGNRVCEKLRSPRAPEP